MKLLDSIWKALRPLRSGDSKLLEQSSELSTNFKTLEVLSSAFYNGGFLSETYSAYGGHKFPGLNWTAVPVACKSILLVVEDPDAPKPTPFVHGIFYNIPPEMRELHESAIFEGELSNEYVEKGVKMGTNSVLKAEYLPPMPPAGHGPHHYHFQLIALDCKLSFSKIPNLSDIKTAIENRVIAYGEIVGIYEK